MRSDGGIQTLLASGDGALSFEYKLGSPDCGNGRTSDAPFGITVFNSGTTTIQNLEMELGNPSYRMNVTSRGSLGLKPGEGNIYIGYVKCAELVKIFGYNSRGFVVLFDYLSVSDDAGHVVTGGQHTVSITLTPKTTSTSGSTSGGTTSGSTTSGSTTSGSTTSGGSTSGGSTTSGSSGSSGSTSGSSGSNAPVPYTLESFTRNSADGANVSSARRTSDSNNYRTGLDNLLNDAASFARTDLCPRFPGVTLAINAQAYATGTSNVTYTRQTSVGCPGQNTGTAYKVHSYVYNQFTQSISQAERDTDSNNWPTALNNLFNDAQSFTRTDICPSRRGETLTVYAEAYPVGGGVVDRRQAAVSCN